MILFEMILSAVEAWSSGWCTGDQLAVVPKYETSNQILAFQVKAEMPLVDNFFLRRVDRAFA